MLMTRPSAASPWPPPRRPPPRTPPSGRLRARAVAGAPEGRAAPGPRGQRRRGARRRRLAQPERRGRLLIDASGRRGRRQGGRLAGRMQRAFEVHAPRSMPALRARSPPPRPSRSRRPPATRLRPARRSAPGAPSRRAMGCRTGEPRARPPACRCRAAASLSFLRRHVDGWGRLVVQQGRGRDRREVGGRIEHPGVGDERRCLRALGRHPLRFRVVEIGHFVPTAGVVSAGAGPPVSRNPSSDRRPANSLMPSTVRSTP